MEIMFCCNDSAVIREVAWGVKKSTTATRQHIYLKQRR